MSTELEKCRVNNMNELETPCFIVRTEKFSSLVNDLKQAIKSEFDNFIIGYSFKTNNMPWIIKNAKSNGLWAEVVSSDEYDLAKKLGYKDEEIIFNGPVKGKEQFITAIENGAVVNIDSCRELDWLEYCDKEKIRLSRVGLRVNFCIEELCPGESQCGTDDGRFGFSYECGELKKAIDILCRKGINLSGLHFHVSSKTRSLNIYKAISKTAVKIIDEYNLHLDYVDIGGGFFGGVPGKPSFTEYLALISDVFSQSSLLDNITLIVEPGMSLIGASVDYLTTVIDVKQTKNNRFVVLDGSRIHIDPLMRKSGYTFRTIYKREVTPLSFDQILCGFTCMEGDRFIKYNGALLSSNDNVLFEKVGAYTMGLSPQFINALPRVYSESNNEYVLVRDKQKLSDT